MKQTRLWLLIVVCLAANVPAQAQKLFEESSDLLPREIERMYSRGLQFLVQSQLAGGNYKDKPYGTSPAAVGLAVVAMLAHGDDPVHGPYSQPIKRGINFILSRQNKTTGYIGTTMYNHGFAALALAEAYGAVEDDRLGPALEKAVGLIINSQKKNPRGGWRYSPDSTDADTFASLAARSVDVAVAALRESPDG